MSDGEEERTIPDDQFVAARLRGPNHDKIMEQARIIERDFNACVARMREQQRARPKENIADIYFEAPFRSEAVAVHRRLIEEDQAALEGQELEHTFEVQGCGIPVVTVEAEERMIRAIEKKKARDEQRKGRLSEWNQDQKKKGETASVSHKPIVFDSLDQSTSCTSCDGPCALDSRRSLMSCSNEPMLPELMADLLAQFYRMGWMTGSGGAMAAISCDNRLLLSPSSLQKERIKACDLFASSPNSMEVKTPVCMPKGKPTACEGIFKMIMAKTGAQCVIHSHSKASNLATRIIGSQEWVISGQEYIKGIYNFRTKKAMDNEDILIVPIIENRATEELLEPQVEAILADPNFAQCSAILVRSHGVFVWGPTWQKAKIMAEVYDYLFELSVDMFRMGLPLIRPDDLSRAVRLGHIKETTSPRVTPNEPCSSTTSTPSAPPAE